MKKILFLLMGLAITGCSTVNTNTNQNLQDPNPTDYTAENLI